jgi:hypothetical protein
MKGAVSLRMKFINKEYSNSSVEELGHPVAQLVEALRYKPEGRGFASRWCHWNFYSHNPSGRTLDLGSTQPLTSMSTRTSSWTVKNADVSG